MSNYRERLAEAIHEARRSGRATRRTFNKAEFLRQYPKARQDPLFMLLPEEFNFNATPLEGISCKELREICNKKPFDPFAVEKLLQTDMFGEDEIVYLLRSDLDRLRKGDTPTTQIINESKPTKVEKVSPPKTDKPSPSKLNKGETKTSDKTKS